MLRGSKELLWAFVAAILSTGFYAFVMAMTGKIPAAGELFGHTLGILGFVLMILTETVYSLRKRTRSARWGKMSEWLQFHIFTGLVGPFMVFLHTSWKFNGLAGAVTLLTVIVVISGFIGRYIYTAVPRTADGAEIESAELERQMLEADAQLREWLAAKPQISQTLQQRIAALPDVSDSGLMAVLGRALIEREYKAQWNREKKHLDARARAQMAEIEKLAERRDSLRRQVSSLAMARRLLALWHTVHIPIGMALFTAAVVHIGGALYYATFLK